MNKEKKIKNLILIASHEEADYWYNTFSELFSPYKNTNLLGTSVYNHKKNKNLTTYNDPQLLLKNEKETVKNYFKGKIPDEKIKIRFNLFEEKYLNMKIKIFLDDESTLLFTNEIHNGRDNHYFQMMRLEYSRMLRLININAYTKYTFIFDKLIEVYNNYSTYLNDYKNVKLQNEKNKKITEITKVSAEQLANKYFENFILNIEGENISLIINFRENFLLKYKFHTDNLVTSFENIKNTFDKTIKLFTSFNKYNIIKIEKIDRENETHKPFIAKEEIQDLLNNEIKLRKQIKEYIIPKIEMRGKKPFIYHEKILPRYFLEDNNICGRPLKAEEEMDSLQKIFNEICTEEKNKIIDSNK